MTISCISCAILRKVEKVLQFEALAGFESRANGIGTVYFVAVTQRLIHGGGYLADFDQKTLSPHGDASQLAWIHSLSRYRSIDIYEEKYRDSYINKQCIFEARKKCPFLSCLASSGIKNTAN